ncbi:L-glutamate gamma-semialdehyde dehydrogenase [Paraburkholderia agricolaris]|uniref:L-glutamate gamma-semialdehyde dehydrogenase n=1 Tax=Paraburkholderia agricolaris TaxID=2152888 RepID=UPI0012918029|nr:L-glutamate gamma-semialdehyde dehydrogenase [Paraburkholderia agricolaris]
MNNEILPVNEPVLTYRPGSDERSILSAELNTQLSAVVEIPVVVGARRIVSGDTVAVTRPDQHAHVLAQVAQAGLPEVGRAIDAAVEAQCDWSRWSFEDRAAVFLKAADLLAGPWRQRLNAATMLGQGKTVQQAEIDSACELIDFLRFNVSFARQIQSMQPVSSKGVGNSLEYRPLEGFVYAVTPFNFTAIGGNLACAPALMGNTVVWKPAATAALSNYLFLQLLEEAGLPPGVINFVPGDAATVTQAVLASSEFAGLHFTGSTTVFDSLWRSASINLPLYRGYPRLVGETGGKDFVLAHRSADVDTLSIALIRGAFEYQGQKCSAASRAYIPSSLWPAVKERLVAAVAEIRAGRVTDFENFISAVIDRKAFSRINGYLDVAKSDAVTQIVAGGSSDDESGYFIEPTVIEASDPLAVTMREEIFGPVLSVYVYPDAKWDEVLRLVDETSPYALTGAVFAQERSALASARDALRFSAGNFYINDKPTGAVVGQQPFGGARRSGTNDKAGSPLNLLRWVSPRTIKETRIADRSYAYPHMVAL